MVHICPMYNNRPPCRYPVRSHNSHPNLFRFDFYWCMVYWRQCTTNYNINMSIRSSPTYPDSVQPVQGKLHAAVLSSVSSHRSHLNACSYLQTWLLYCERGSVRVFQMFHFDAWTRCSDLEQLRQEVAKHLSFFGHKSTCTHNNGNDTCQCACNLTMN